MSCPHGVYSSWDKDNEQVNIKCHMAICTVENNKTEKGANECSMVCAGRLVTIKRVIRGCLTENWKK